MSTCLLTNPVPEDRTASAETFAAWTALPGQLGDNLADRGNPAFTRTTVAAAGPALCWAGARWSPPAAWRRRLTWPEAFR
jgi:hypothetical protein